MKIDFLTMVWLFPIFLLVHELEEWNIVKWYDKHFVDLPQTKSNTSTRFFLIFISIIGFIWTGIAVIPRNENVAIPILAPFVVIVLQNIFQHIYWSFLVKSVAPGTVSAILLLLPVSTYILLKGYHGGAIPSWAFALFAVYLAFGIRETIKAKNTLSKSFKKINQFSNYMVKLIGIGKRVKKRKDL